MTQRDLHRATVDLRIVGRDLPGLRFGDRDPVYLGVQREKEVVGLVPGDAAEAVFRISVDVVVLDEGALDFRGPFAHGKRGERFIYLSWGQLQPGGRFEMFRRAKLHLSVLDEKALAQALGTGCTIEATLGLTDSCGGPLCASIRPPKIEWRINSPVRAR